MDSYKNDSSDLEKNIEMSPKQKEKKVFKNEDANDFFQSYEQFLLKMNESE